ncbi:Lysophospholipase L1 [Paenibacillus catalpae]|uniref:Lysophospholipase L1 n=1 Tax=Paenibacillus catalpae TaxID=1045775 RepID=A0A1I2FVB9_9BACL|nr:SGNH/GDSL hydrolase family protein [Paenibacillus catalpae]SFF08620.1 Lysophospholipase L1 [Paenibacillus catalpae]
MTEHLSLDAAEEPVDLYSEAYYKMIAKSLLEKGNNKRLKAAIEKAKRGDDVTLAFIGGSITHGAGADPLHTGCYAYRTYTAFKERFGKEGGDHIHFIKAGLGGTPSELGMIRYERDVLRDGTVQPDIVVVEFAVNDADDETNGICYESLVRKALGSANAPAVILLFSVFENDWNLQDRLSLVGKHYGLPMVSVKDAVTEQFYMSKEEGNVISKQQFFSDIYHPTNAGHRIMADCLNWLLSETDRLAPNQADIALNKPPVFGNDFANVQLLDRENGHGIAKITEGSFHAADSDLQFAEMDDSPYGTPQFPYNWMHTSESGSDSFIMTLHSKNLLLVYKNSGSDEFGNADIRVDGKLVKVAESQTVKWTRCHAVILYAELNTREHTVEIKMAAGHESKHFTILGFGFN